MCNDVLRDRYNRRFYYLRLSITDLCNFNCKYCLPDKLYVKAKNYLSVDEIYNLISAFSDLGVEKIRLTGGEPTVRSDFIAISKMILSFSNIKSLVFTTNGYRLFNIVQDIYDIGFSGVNVSLDTLNVEKFCVITGKNYFVKVIDGIYKSLSLGLKTKINIVLSRFFSLEDFEEFYSFIKYKNVSIRFIEQMDTMFVKNKSDSCITSSYIVEFLKKNGWKKEQNKSFNAGPAVIYINEQFCGKIGIINPYSDLFCLTCNRLRISSVGGLHLCLFGDKVYSLRHLLKFSKKQDELKRFIFNIVKIKKNSHSLYNGDFGMIKNFASIGG